MLSIIDISYVHFLGDPGVGGAVGGQGGGAGGAGGGPGHGGGGAGGGGGCAGWLSQGGGGGWPGHGGGIPATPAFGKAPTQTSTVPTTPAPGKAPTQTSTVPTGPPPPTPILVDFETKAIEDETVTGADEPETELAAKKAKTGADEAGDSEL